MSENNFSAISQMVTEARSLLDTIKGGAISTMQTQFETIKSQMSEALSTVSSDLAVFVNQEKSKIAALYSTPDARYQKIQPVAFTIGGETDKFYPVVFGSTNVNRLTEIHIGRFIHSDGSNKGAMYVKFIASSYAWGGRPSTMVLDTLKTLIQVNGAEQHIVDDGFVGSYSGAGLHPNGVVVWLRGGYSYEAWVEGADLNRVDMTSDKTVGVANDNAMVYLNGYERTANGQYQAHPVLTKRNTTLIPNFTNYEKA